MKSKLPPCPRCNSAKQVVSLAGGEAYRCAKCGGIFDDDPDEGGDYSDRDPGARLDRAERRRGGVKSDRPGGADISRGEVNLTAPVRCRECGGLVKVLPCRVCRWQRERRDSADRAGRLVR